MINRLLNGFQSTFRGYFLWLNAYGFGVGREDLEGLGRGQFIVYRLGRRVRRG